MPDLNLQDWEDEKKMILSAWLEFLGKGPECREVSGLKVLSTSAVGNCVREKIQYEVYPGCAVEAYVIRPLKTSDRLPAIVSLHQTIDCTIDEPAGLAGASDLHIGLHLAERGFVTINPRCFLWERPGLSWAEAAAALKQQFPDWTGMGRMLWDAQCAVDVLCSLPYVDEKLIGAIGHSLGGKEAFYLAAFDPRVKATVCSEMGIGLDMSNWDAEHFLGPAVSHEGFSLSHHEVLALIAPKPFLLIAGDSADGRRSDELYIRQVQSIYQLYNAEEKIRFFNHHLGHSFPETAQAAAYHWLEEWL